MPGGARVGVDVGGTFTDIVVLDDAGTLTLGKVPSTPADQSEGLERGVRDALARAGQPRMAVLAHGTTVATNAVLERRGARTGLVTTDGFRDVLIIGRQQRPKLYDLAADRPEPIVARPDAVGVPERVGRDGEVLIALDEDAARASIEALVNRGIESVAVCLLFSFANPAHEQRVRELVAACGAPIRVSLSSEVLPEFREYERASTTALDAYVGPVVERYVERITERVADLGAPVVVMRSGGGTMSAAVAGREPVHTLLSGPAAGVRGAAIVARAAGFDDVVTFDMGGTSTDVCLVEGGAPAIATEATIGGLPFRTPSVAVHTVGAGGGSILWIDPAGALRAGPRSAGAEPGPACYGRGGSEPAVTDAHAFLGHLDPTTFLGGRMPLDLDASARALDAVATRLGVSPGEVARAGLRAARASMAKAIRVVTVERGRDPRSFALVAFGGAGPMHATALADELEMRTVIIPPAAGVLSALGLLAAPLTADASRTNPLVDPSLDEVTAVLASLVEEATAGLRAQGAEAEEVATMADCRYLGQAHEVTVDASTPADIATRFHHEHRARFGWDAPGDPVEVVTFRARATGPAPGLTLPTLPAGTGSRPAGSRRMGFGDEDVTAPVYARAQLGAGDDVAGPCAIEGEESTTLIDPGWRAGVDQHGTIVAVRS